MLQTMTPFCQNFWGQGPREVRRWQFKTYRFPRDFTLMQAFMSFLEQEADAFSFMSSLDQSTPPDARCRVGHSLPSAVSEGDVRRGLMSALKLTHLLDA